jgi:hypothetical protein
MVGELVRISRSRASLIVVAIPEHSAPVGHQE